MAAAASWNTAALWRTRLRLKNLLQLAVDAGSTQDIVPVARPRAVEQPSSVERSSEHGPKNWILGGFRTSVIRTHNDSTHEPPVLFSYVGPAGFEPATDGL